MCFVPPVILTTHSPILPVPGMITMSLFQKVIYNHLATLPLFKTVMTTYCYDHYGGLEENVTHRE